jgi:hypothetical protein
MSVIITREETIDLSDGSTRYKRVKKEKKPANRNSRKGGYHLTQKDEVYIAVFTKGTKVKFVTSYSMFPKEAKWEDGKQAMKIPLGVANEIVMGLCMNGYSAFIADMYYYDKVINPVAKKEE